jgi:RNA polymerase primary sigma factor
MKPHSPKELTSGNGHNASFSEPELNGSKSANREWSALEAYMKDVSTYPLLDRTEEIALFKKIHKGDENARQQMIQSNLRLVVKIAKEYDGSGVNLLDLINEGNMGLMEAVDRFKPSKGAKLSTYAGFWIKQKIRRCVMSDSRTVRIPIHMGEKLYKLNRTRARLQDALERDPTDEELAQEMGVPIKVVETCKKVYTGCVSLETPVGEDGATLGDFIGDHEHGLATAKKLEHDDNLSITEQLFEHLSEREIFIIKKRFGFDNEKPEQLDKIGEKYGVTRERIRQIQAKALRRLRVAYREIQARKMINQPHVT